MFGTGYPARRLLLALLGIAVAALLETFQSWAPGRHANVSDFAMNAIGMCVGVAFVAAVDRIKRAIRDAKASRRAPAVWLITESADSARSRGAPLHPPGAQR